MTEQAPAFGEQLRRYRERVGLSQEALAELAELTTSAIGALERGRRQRPYPHTVRRLADALALSAEERVAFGVARAVPAMHPAGSRAATARPTNLPEIRTSLIGREQAVAALRDRVAGQSERLVTLTGIGGSGKTSLALQVAAEVRETFPEGVWFVELAPLADLALVPQAVAGVLDLPEVAAVPPMERLVTALRSRTLLLLLDNCEHLIEACAALAERLLGACPRVHILATSREPLQLAGEVQWRVPPLALPDAGGSGSLAELAASAAVRLFVERARAVDTTFGLTEQNAEAVVQICTELAGIPLAIELAAARVRVLAVAQIRDRLADSLRLLSGASRAAPTRQQTLRAALDWSYDLLSEPEQIVFRRLAVFAGTFELAAAEAVCATEHLPAEAVLDVLAQLVDKSLVLVEQGAEMARYRLLAPVRQYAAQRCTSDEMEAVQARHAAYYFALAERAAPMLSGPEQAAWLARLESESGNLRAALRWAERGADAELFLRMAIALAGFWEGHSHFTEGKQWLCSALSAGERDGIPGGPRARALIAAGHLAFQQTDPAALRWLEEGLELARQEDDHVLIADALAWIGIVLVNQGEMLRAIDLLEESLALARAHDNRIGVAIALLTLGVGLRFHGEIERSAALLTECRERYFALGDVRRSAMACSMLGFTLFERGDLDRAAALLREGMAGHWAVGDRSSVAVGFMDLAGVLAAQGCPRRAAQLLGAMAALRDVLAAPLSTASQRTYARIEKSAQDQLSPTDYAAAWREGHAMPLREAVAMALEEPPGEAAPASFAPIKRASDATEATSEPLTAREREVAHLLRQGYTDRQIAVVLGISPRTVSVHVQHVLAKLGLRSRWQIEDRVRATGPHDTGRG